MTRKRSKESDLERLLGNPIILIVIFFILLLSAFPFYFQKLDYVVIALTVLMIIVVVSSLIGLWYLKRVEMRRLHALEMADIDKMDGFSFEHYVGELLKAQGYKISYTPPAADYGTDIIASDGTNRISVQVKRYKGFVGEDAVRQAVTAMPFYGCNKAMVVTNSKFSSYALNLAKAHQCQMVDRSELAKWIDRFQRLTKD